METTPSRRSFGGKLENFTDKQERLFEQKHLRAYIKGWKQFAFGFEAIHGNIHGKRERVYHKVKEIWA